MLDPLTKQVYTYCIEKPIYIGDWNISKKTLDFKDGAIEYLRTGNITSLYG